MYSSSLPLYAAVQSFMHPIRLRCMMGQIWTCDVSRDEGAGCMAGYRMAFGSGAPVSLFISSQIPQTDPLPVCSP